ncbi:MAG: T9SS type A sorting domain-containing protein [Bacteroidota bacterium]|nr:T9SS type A sorting domain-containing protein [Bacteroidota bacterium]
MFTPNPTRGILNVSYHSPGNEKINIRLADVSGQIVFTDQADVKTGDNSILVDLGAIATGLYNLSLSTNTGNIIFLL